MSKKNKRNRGNKENAAPETAKPEPQILDEAPEDGEPDEASEGPGTVTFAEFCQRMAATGLAVPEIGNRATASEAKRWAKVFVETLARSVGRGERVRIPDLGSFGRGQRLQREGRNPRTGEPIIIPAHKVPTFSPAKALKELVNGD